MDNFHLIVVYFISLSIISIEGGDWDNNWYEDYYPARPQSPGAGNPAPLPARHPSPPQPAQRTARQSSPPQPAQQTARQSSPPQPAQRTAWQSSPPQSAQQTMRKPELAPQQALQRVPQQAWQRAPQQTWPPAPPMHLTSDQHKNKRPASPSGPSSALKRQNTGVSSSSTSSPVNTIAELFHIMDGNRDNRIFFSNYHSVLLKEIYKIRAVRDKLDEFFLNSDGSYNRKKVVGFLTFGLCPVNLATMNNGKPFSKEDLIRNFGILVIPAGNIIRDFGLSVQGKITAAELAQFFRGDKKFDS